MTQKQKLTKNLLDQVKGMVKTIGQLNNLGLSVRIHKGENIERRSNEGSETKTSWKGNLTFLNNEKCVMGLNVVETIEHTKDLVVTN